MTRVPNHPRRKTTTHVVETDYGLALVVDDNGGSAGAARQSLAEAGFPAKADRIPDTERAKHSDINISNS